MQIRRSEVVYLSHSALLRFFCFAKAPGAPRPGPRPPRGARGLGGFGGRTNTEFLVAGAVWDPSTRARGRRRQTLTTLCNE